MRHPASQAFHDVLTEMGLLHNQKQADYGRENDPFANVRASEDFGVPGWVGCLTRANDKMRRLQKAAQGGTLTNETVEDSLLDLAVYAAIGLVLYREVIDVPEVKCDCGLVMCVCQSDPVVTPPVDRTWPEPPPDKTCDCT